MTKQNRQQTLIKLAQINSAIKFVLRTRMMNKMAAGLGGGTIAPPQVRDRYTGQMRPMRTNPTPTFQLPPGAYPLQHNSGKRPKPVQPPVRPQANAVDPDGDIKLPDDPRKIKRINERSAKSMQEEQDFRDRILNNFYNNWQR